MTGTDLDTVFIAFGIFFLLAICVVMVLRIALPLSIFEMRDVVKELLKEQRRTREILEGMAERGAEKGAGKGPEAADTEAKGAGE
jgi:hypothetical protein